MSEIQNNANTYEDEIDLRELIMALWRSKYIIISIAIIAAILTGLYSMFMLSPVYQTRLDIVINMPEQYPTRFGDYTLPLTTNDQYINLITSNQVLTNTIRDMDGEGSLSLEGLRNRISIQKGSDASNQNSFTVMVSAGSPEESLQLAQTLFDNYIGFVDMMTKDRAIEHYFDKFSTDQLVQENSLKTKQELLKKNEELLAVTPQTINQQEAMNQIQDSLIDTVDFVVMENVINPNYVEIEKQIISLKQEIYTIEDTMRRNSEYLAQLEEERQVIAEYYQTGDDEGIEPSLNGVVRTNIYLPSQPVAPSGKSSPSTTRNVAIGLVIGLMIGFITAYVREFWLKQTK